jgi:hypothetical protein
MARPWFERAVAAAEQGDIHGQVDHGSLGVSLRDAPSRTGRVALDSSPPNADCG